MDRCSSGGEIREESEKKETEEKESVERRLSEKVARPQNTVFRVEKYVGSLKGRVQSHVAGWEITNCTPLWHEADLEVKMELFKKCTRLWHEAHGEVKMLKHDTFGPLLELEMSKKVHAAVARSTFRSQKGYGLGPPFWDKARWTFEEDLQRCSSRGRHSTRDISIRHVRRSGRWFSQRSCILEHQIFRFAKIILRRVQNFIWLGCNFLAGAVL